MATRGLRVLIVLSQRVSITPMIHATRDDLYTEQSIPPEQHGKLRFVASAPGGFLRSP